MNQQLPDSSFKAVINKIALQRKAANFWAEHVKTLRASGLIREIEIRKLILLTQPKNIGFDEGQIRPGELGRWDVYYSLMGQMDSDGAAILASLTPGEIKRHQQLEYAGVDTENPEEVGEFDRI